MPCMAPLQAVSSDDIEPVMSSMNSNRADRDGAASTMAATAVAGGSLEVGVRRVCARNGEVSVGGKAGLY